MSRRSGLNAARRRVIKAQLAERDGAACFFCRRPFGPGLDGATIDHLIPYSRFPRNLQINLVLACTPCNTAKGDQLPQEFLAVSVDELAARAGTTNDAVLRVLWSPERASAKSRTRVLAALRHPTPAPVPLPAGGLEN